MSAPVPTKEGIEKSINTRKIQKEKGQDLISNFADLPLWLELFKQHGIKCPVKYLLPEPHLMRKYLRKLKVSDKEYKFWTGFKHLEEFAILNPRFPLYAWLGVVCEYIEMRNDIEMLLTAQNIRFDD